MVFNYYSIPFIVNDYKRSFSGAKLTIDGQRLSLKAITLNYIESLKFWLVFELEEEVVDI